MRRVPLVRLIGLGALAGALYGVASTLAAAPDIPGLMPFGALFGAPIGAFIGAVGVAAGAALTAIQRFPRALIAPGAGLATAATALAIAAALHASSSGASGSASPSTLQFVMAPEMLLICGIALVGVTAFFLVARPGSSASEQSEDSQPELPVPAATPNGASEASANQRLDMGWLVFCGALAGGFYGAFLTVTETAASPMLAFFGFAFGTVVGAFMGGAALAAGLLLSRIPRLPLAVVAFGAASILVVSFGALVSLPDSTTNILTSSFFLVAAVIAFAGTAVFFLLNDPRKPKVTPTPAVPTMGA